MFRVIVKTKIVLFVLMFHVYGITFGKETDNKNQNDDYRWSAWSQFSLCTRSCGVGIKRRHRTCYISGSAPVPVKTTLCEGVSEAYQTCNVQDCPIDSVDFRRLQCAYFDGVSHKHRKHKWIPFETGHLSARAVRVMNPCALICSPVSMSQFAVKFSSQVVDGTHCSSDPLRICVQGVCKSLSCDMKIDSDKVSDSCGICGGDGTSCLPVTGSIYRNISAGYHDLLNIPKGATNINIQELANSRALLALKSPSGIYFVIDNHKPQPITKLIAGSRFYHRRTHPSNRLEYLKSKGPTTQTITLLGFTRKMQAEISIQYEYTLNSKGKIISNLPPLKSERSYDWKTLLYHQMILKKGMLGPSTVTTITTSENMIKTTKFVTDTNSEMITTRAPETTESNQQEVTSISQAETSSSEPVYEIKEKGIPQFIPENEGSNVDKLGLVIETSAQGSKDRHLEIGINVRRSSPRKGFTNRKQKPSNGFFWKRNRITDCSSTCTADGTQVSFFSCFRRDGTQVDDVFCDVNTKPDPKYHECTGNRCPPRWVVGKWSACSGTCSDGTQTRSVRCWQMLAPGFDSTVPEYRCNQSLKPPVSQNCTVSICEPKWEMSSWRECSTMCGNGTQSRHVRCSTGADNHCDRNTKPVSVKTCFQSPCTSRWFTETWSACDGKCGVGVRKRRVGCQDKIGRQMSDSFCDGDVTPLSVKACGNKLNCAPVWVPQEWEQCRATCGESYAQRKIVCGSVVSGRFRLLADTKCHHLPKPRMLATCINKKCGAQWYATEFTECSATCGENAVRTRSVKCYNDNIPSDMCLNANKPPEVEICHNSACPNDECKNKILNCHLLVKDLCKQTYYATNCCKTCQMP